MRSTWIGLIRLVIRFFAIVSILVLCSTLIVSSKDSAVIRISRAYGYSTYDSQLMVTTISNATDKEDLNDVIDGVLSFGPLGKLLGVEPASITLYAVALYRKDIPYSAFLDFSNGVFSAMRKVTHSIKQIRREFDIVFNTIYGFGSPFEASGYAADKGYPSGSALAIKEAMTWDNNNDEALWKQICDVFYYPYDDMSCPFRLRYRD